MHLDHEFTVPVPAEQAWPVLLDVERIGPCMPGATITKVEGKEFEGKVKVKVGPITVTYAGQATFDEIDDQQRKAVIIARGKEARGSGTANATITAQLHDQGESTRVTVHTDLAITGRPAQFGRGVMADVGGKLLGRFADCLARQLSGEQAAPEAPEAAAPVAETTPAESPAAEADTAAAPSAAQVTTAAAEPTAGTQERASATAGTAAGTAAGAARQPRPVAAAPRQDEAIDLLEAAGGPILKRLAPVAAGIVLLALLFAILRRHRR